MAGPGARHRQAPRPHTPQLSTQPPAPSHAGGALNTACNQLDVKGPPRGRRAFTAHAPGSGPDAESVSLASRPRDPAEHARRGDRLKTGTGGATPAGECAVDPIQLPGTLHLSSKRHPRPTAQIKGVAIPRIAVVGFATPRIQRTRTLVPHPPPSP